MLIRVHYGEREVTEPAGESLGYTYWSDTDVSVGDIVLVPGTFVHPSPQPATVIGIGSNYAGPLSNVLYVLRRRGEAARA